MVTAVPSIIEVVSLLPLKVIYVVLVSNLSNYIGKSYAVSIDQEILQGSFYFGIVLIYQFLYSIIFHSQTNEEFPCKILADIPTDF